MNRLLATNLTCLYQAGGHPSLYAKLKINGALVRNDMDKKQRLGKFRYDVCRVLAD